MERNPDLLNDYQICALDNPKKFIKGANLPQIHQRSLITKYFKKDDPTFTNDLWIVYISIFVNVKWQFL